MFDAPATANSQRKQLIRAVISEITLTIDRQAGTCRTLITWQGTATSEVTFPLPKRGSGAITTSEDTVSLVRRLAGQYNDTTIARILARQHRRTATGLPWTRERVSDLRRCHGIPHCPDRPGNVSGTGHDDVMATVPQAAQLLGVDKTTIYRWLRDGFITGEQLTPSAPWKIRITQALRDKIRPDVPDGWLPLDQAAKVLGVARQTVLHKVQRGELNAVHLTSGRRKGLRIQAGHDQPGLFDTPHGKKGAVLTMTDLAGDHADGPPGDGPGDAGGGLGPVGVPVQPPRGQVAAERHAGQAEPVDDGVDHDSGSFREGPPLTAASCCWAHSRSRARAAALARAPEMNSHASLTATAGSVPSSQPSRPAARAAASQVPTWPSSCGIREAASDSSPRTSQASDGCSSPSPPRVAWFRQRTASAAVRARAAGRLRGVSHDRLLFLSVLAAVDEGPVADLLLRPASCASPRAAR